MGLVLENCDSETRIDMTGMNRLLNAHFNRLRSILTIVIDVTVKGGDFGVMEGKNRLGCIESEQVLSKTLVKTSSGPI
jgi:hypothetical protein